MNNNINHKKGFEEAIAGLSRGNWHNEDFNCQFGLLLEVGKTLAEYSLEIIEKLGRDNSLNLEKSKEALKNLEYQKQAIFYFAAKELMSTDFAHLSDLIFYHKELKEQAKYQ
jgi:hypothetical protein